jgi:GLPGLI family protein
MTLYYLLKTNYFLMQKIFIATLLLVASTFTAHAQHTTLGKIPFERRVNIHAQLEEMQNNSFFEKMKAQIPKFNSSYFDLRFDTTRSIYKPGREVEGNSVFKMFGGGPATENTVLTHFQDRTIKANKTVFEQKFFVTDSIRVIDWKEKDEIRTIAGFKCHKAVGIICDSVYVVAFYTEDIIVAGGPEMFGGLPGMIMELAIPRLHTTWIATKVDLTPPLDTDFTITEKGKKVTEKELYQNVSESFKKWGSMAARNIWWTVL